MLLNFTGFRTAGDVWAVGVIILDVLTNHVLPWNASNAWLEVAEMTKIFGGAVMRKYATEIGVTVQDIALKKFVENPSVTFEELVVRRDLRDSGLINLMKRLLTLDYRLRPTAEQALADLFFQTV
jgi:serine/threonine protein kinase